MIRVLVSVGLLICLFVPQHSIADHDPSSELIYWEVDLNNGFISTKPMIIDDSVIVRTSDFWSGDDRPKVYSFDLQTGNENWRFTNNYSRNHDVSPLSFATSSSGDCGSWGDMVLVGWTDGKVTALDFESGELIWQSQTEVVDYGITGKMVIDQDQLVVPTNKGLSKFCLADGSETLRVDLPQKGWRNGITLTDSGYLLGNEEGILNQVSKDGIVTSQEIGEGKIRHAPLVTTAGVLIHLQMQSSSGIYVDGELVSTEGSSPAIPLQVGNKVYLGTNTEVLLLNCEQSCNVTGRTDYQTSGEIVRQYIPERVDRVWFSHNSQDGGWSYGTPGQNLTLYETKHNTFKTAGPGFSEDGSIAFGNDNGILMVFVGQISDTEKSSQANDDYSIDFDFGLLLILLLIISAFYFQVNTKENTVVKAGLLVLLVIAVVALPDVSTKWSQEVSKLETPTGDWDESWPDEWQDTQVLVIELPNETLVVGGYSDYNTVEELTEIASVDLGLIVEYETTDIGVWITSIGGYTGSGWEFTIDGTRSNVGISLAEIDEDSVVRWSLA